MYVEGTWIFCICCIKTRKELEQFFSIRNWFVINDEVAYKRMLKCTKVVQLKIFEFTSIKLDVNDRINLVRYKWV
jgi:hypothetical protein